MTADRPLTPDEADEIRRLAGIYASTSADSMAAALSSTSTVRSRAVAAENVGEAFGRLIAYLDELAGTKPTPERAHA